MERLRTIRLSDVLGSQNSERPWGKILAILLVLAMIGTIGTLACVMTVPKVGERFTEFYVLGIEGKAGNYPTELTLGEKGRVILGIVNREYETTEYKVQITIDREKVGELEPIALNQEEKWEQEVSFAPTRAGPKQKVEFLLYKGADRELYQTLHLLINVKEAR